LDTWNIFCILPYVLMSTMVSPAMEIETGNATALGHRKAPLSKQNAVEPPSVFVCECSMNRRIIETEASHRDYSQTWRLDYKLNKACTRDVGYRSA
jgi:hypothetical protein